MMMIMMMMMMMRRRRRMTSQRRPAKQALRARSPEVGTVAPRRARPRARGSPCAQSRARRISHLPHDASRAPGNHMRSKQAKTQRIHTHMNEGGTTSRRMSG
jgi:hypothetical protein